MKQRFMKHLLFFVFSVSSFIGLAQKWGWAQASSGGLGKGIQTATNNKGEVFLLTDGSSYFTINNGSQSFLAGAGITKFDPSGQPQWAYAFKYAVTSAVSADSSGNVYVCGPANTGAIFYNSGGSDTITTLDNSSDAFIAKYNGNGKLLWVKTYGDTVSDESFATIKNDAKGNSYASGYSLYPDPHDHEHTFAKFFIHKYDGNGNLVWARSTAWDNYAQPYTADLDEYGNSYIAGVFYSAVTIGSVTLACPPVSTPWHMFMLKYDKDGNLQWLKQEGTSTDVPAAISVDNKGNFYMTGMASYPTTFGSTASISGPFIYSGMFISKHDSLGNLLWVKSEGARYPAGIACDSTGFFLTGDISPPENNPNGATTGTLGIGSSTIYLSSVKRGDFFVAKYTENGIPEWAIMPGTSGCCFNWSNHISSDRNGNCYVTGRFEGTMTMRPNTLVSAYTNNINYDAFVVKVSELAPTVNGVMNVPDQGQMFSVFPNPAHNTVNISYMSEEDCKSIDLKLSNTLGQHLYSRSCKNQREINETIDVSQYPKGVYFIELLTPQRREVKKVVVE